MAGNRYKDKLTQQPNDVDLRQEMRDARTSGSDDIVSAEIEAQRVNIPNEVDKEEFYGDLYDNIQPDIKFLRGTLSRTMLFNGTTFDRQRSNQDFIALQKTNYEFPPLQIESQTFVNYNSKGAIILFDASDKGAFDRLVVNVEGRELVSGQFYNILNTPVLIANFLYVLKIYPGLNPVPGFVSNDILPRFWRITVSHITVTPILYGATAQVIL